MGAPNTTPGPWTTSTGFCLAPVTVRSPEGRLATVYCPSLKVERAAADAHQIAASPELYDALELCVQAREQWIKSITDEEGAVTSAALDRAHEMARAALALARGEHP